MIAESGLEGGFAIVEEGGDDPDPAIRRPFEAGRTQDVCDRDQICTDIRKHPIDAAI